MKARFLQELAGLQALALAQRILRMLVRGAWLGMGVSLAAWGLDQMLGWKLAAALTPWVLWAVPAVCVLTVLWPLPTRKRLAWQLDRRLGYQEQITTALQAVQGDEPETMERLLVEDASRLARNALRRVALHGWRLGPDLLSLLIMAVLAFLAAQAQAFPEGLALAPAQAEGLPAAGQEVRAEDIFPAGIPGLRNTTTRAASGTRYSADELEQLRAALEEMGKDLAQQSGTYELGKALQENRLDEAARRMEELAGQINDLSEDSREQIANALKKAGQTLEGNGPQSLADELKQAAEGIERGRERETTDTLEKLARELRGMARQPGEQARQGINPGMGPGGNASHTGASEPFERLAGGEGEPVQLAENHPFLSPAQGQTVGDETISGASDHPASQGADQPGALLVPYFYPWTWRNVVSQYFSH